MGNWGDDWDPEVINHEDPKGRFTINFKKISYDMDEIIESTKEVDDKHPKNELLKEWAGAMTGCFILFCLAYRVFAFVMVPFFFFYLLALGRIGGAWKQFNYKRAQYWAMTIGALIVLLAIALTLQHFILG